MFNYRRNTIKRGLVRFPTLYETKERIKRIIIIIIIIIIISVPVEKVVHNTMYLSGLESIWESVSVSVSVGGNKPLGYALC